MQYYSEWTSFPEKKYVRGNQSLAIMQRSKLRNILLKNRTEENRNNVAKEGSLCFTLLGKSKREIYGNLNEKKLCDNKKFCSAVKPVLSNKVVCNEQNCSYWTG